MKSKKSYFAQFTTLFMFLTMLVAPTAWGERKILYSFTGLADGNAPASGLVLDAAGNLYGTTPSGGSQAGQCLSIGGCGVVFELTPNSDGTWTDTTIHTFVGVADGIQPHGNLVLDGSGNLYGTTIYGGNGCTGYYSCGTVYELSPDGTGSWTETIIYTFKGGTDGNYPQAGLIFDSAGNLYGTTGFGANSACNGLGCGTVFELTPSQNGTWAEHVLYAFQDGTDGAEPGSALTFDKAGNLYGTAAIGGTLTCNPPYGCGTIYELAASPGGWSQSVLHSFDCGNTGCFPSAGVVFNGRGDLFGNVIGGPSGYGFVFRLRQSGGSWNFALVHSFDLAHGAEPGATPVFDTMGRLFGTTVSGGHQNRSCKDGCGGVFLLAPGNGGIRFRFLGFGQATNGAGPEGSLIFDALGNAYGTTSGGGPNGGGTVFEITP
jgi:uncharacterized repeat protein (TIGR03803 family)